MWEGGNGMRWQGDPLIKLRMKKKDPFSLKVGVKVE